MIHMDMTLCRASIGLVTTLLIGCANVSSDLSEDVSHTNVLLIITDQQRWDALSIAGNEYLSTPNLDRLANEGAYFRNAYTQNAVCAPARASILTGHTVEHTGINDNKKTYDVPDDGLMPMPTLDEILSYQHGYVSEYYGKWHSLTSRADVYQNPVRETNRGDSIFGRKGMKLHYQEYLGRVFPYREPKGNELLDTFSNRPYRPSPMDRKYGSVYQGNKKKYTGTLQPDAQGVSVIPANYSITAYQARSAIDALERRKNEPFSLTVSFHYPHAPMLPSARYYEKFSPQTMPVPSSISDAMTDSPYHNGNRRLLLTEYADKEKIQYMTAAYYALVTELDDWIGEILLKLDELGLSENTLVVFTSDHGEMLGAHGMREKNVFYEESARVPLIIRLPNKIKPNTVVEGYVSNMDIFPTVLDYLEAGDYASDGQSLRGLISGENEEHGQYVVTEWDFNGDFDPNYMVVEGGWKLMMPYTKESKVPNAMYNLNDDPHELHNLLAKAADRSTFKVQAQQLKGRLLQWLKAHESIHYEGVFSRPLQ